MQITGTIIDQLPLQSGTSKAGKAWQQKTFVVEVPGQFPRKIAFDLFGDKCSQFPTVVGTTVTVDFEVESHEYQGRWYTKARAWGLAVQAVRPDGLQPAQPAPASTAYAASTAQPVAPAPQPQPVAANDLPF